ncbi:hypothetical protein M5K25_002063 [Dendrobium thyrsiflorum]|uniref:Uncharacterized protein n=1 Tax=Dendrobium thyrsiflorum TaxID=117978 RepID=A0ABD0VTE0_DENTH
MESPQNVKNDPMSYNDKGVVVHRFEDLISLFGRRRVVLRRIRDAGRDPGAAAAASAPDRLCS